MHLAARAFLVIKPAAASCAATGALLSTYGLVAAATAPPYCLEGSVLNAGTPIRGCVTGWA